MMTRYKKYLIPVLIASSLTVVVKIAADMPERSKCNDFAVHYLTSQIYLEGRIPYGIELEPYYQAQGFQYDGVINTPTNPPTLTAFFALFCRSDADASYVRWMFFQTMCLGLLLEMMRRHFFRGQLLAWFVMVSLLLISKPLVQHYRYAQVQLFLIVLIYAGFYLVQRSRYTLGCSLVAFAGVLKLYPLVLLPWFLWQGNDSVTKKAIRGSLIVGLMAVAFLSFGKDMWLGFAEHAMPLITQMAATEPQNNSVPATMMQLYTASIGIPPATVRLAITLVGLGIIAVAYVICFLRRREATEGSVSELEFGFLLTAMIAGSTTAWMHYYLFLLLPVIWLYQAMGELSRTEKVTWLISVLAIAFGLKVEIQSAPVVWVLACSLPAFAALAIYVMLAKRLLRTWSIVPFVSWFESKVSVGNRVAVKT